MLGRILVFLGGLVLVALVAALLAPFFIDWTDFRREFETEASRILGKKVVVHGTVDARILPFPSVTLSDVRVGGDGEPLVTVTRFSMDAELAPLLSGEARIYDMRLEHPVLNLKLNKDGTLDWMRTGTPEIPAKTVTLEKVEVTGAEITFVDEQTGRTRTGRAIDASISAETLAGPWRMTGRGIFDGQAATFQLNAGALDDDGALSLRSRIEAEALPYSVELDGLVRLVDLKPRYDGRFLIVPQASDPANGDDAARKTPGPRLTGQFELANDRIRVPDYELKIGPVDDPYLVNGEFTLDTGRSPEFLLTAKGQQVDIDRFAATEDDGTAVPQNLASRIRGGLAVIADIPVPQVPGRAVIELPALLAGDTTIRAVSLTVMPDGDSWYLDNAAAELPGRTRIEAKGRLRLKDREGFNGSLLIASAQPSGLSQWLTGAVPPGIRALKSAGFSADVDLTADLQRLENLEIALGPATLEGRLERIAADGQSPSLSIELAGDRLDLEAAQGLAGLMIGDMSPGALLGHRLSANLKLGTFSAFGETAERFSALLSLTPEQMTIDRLDIGALRGASMSFSGAFSLASEAPTGRAHLALKAADASGIAALAAERLPAHPMLDRLVAAAPHLSDLDLAANIRVGGEEWPYEARLNGTANNTSLQLHAAARALDPANPGDLVIELEATNPSVPVLLAQAGLPVLPVDGAANGQIALNVEAADGSAPTLRLSLTADGNALSLEGSTDLSARNFLDGSYHATLDSDDLEPFAFLAGIALPGAGTGLPAKLDTTLYVTRDTVAFENLTGQMADNPLTANISITRTGTPTRLAGDLAIGTADVSWLAETVFGPVLNAEGTLSAEAIGETRDYGFAADLAVTADRLAIDPLPAIDKASFNLAAKAGKLSVSRLNGTFADGRLAGQADLSNAAGTGLLRADLTLTDADLAGLITSVGARLPATGRADISLSLETSAKTVADLPAALTGAGALGVRNLSIARLDQNALSGLIAAADQMPGEIGEAQILPLAEQAIANGPFAVSEARLPFSIAGGVVRAQNIRLFNDVAALSAEASIGLPDDSVNATARLAFVPGAAELAGAEPAISIEFTGRASDPGRTVKATELANFLALRKYEAERRRVEILQARLAERQRLRREAQLYRLAEAERQRIRLRDEAQARLFENAQRLLAEKAKRELEVPAPPLDDIIVIPDQP